FRRGSPRAPADLAGTRRQGARLDPAVRRLVHSELPLYLRHPQFFVLRHRDEPRQLEALLDLQLHRGRNLGIDFRRCRVSLRTCFRTSPRRDRRALQRGDADSLRARADRGSFRSSFAPAPPPKNGDRRTTPRLRNMHLMKAGVIAVVFAGTISVAQAATCYRAEEVEADQAVRFQTQLMVVSDSCGSESYTEFTHRNASTLRAYQEKMIGYFRRVGGRSADSAFDKFITSLANQMALSAGKETVGALCTRSADL